jgi:hypothetical protein
MRAAPRGGIRGTKTGLLIGERTFSTADAGTFKRAIDMTDDELAAIVARAKLTVDGVSPALARPHSSPIISMC